MSARRIPVSYLVWILYMLVLCTTMLRYIICDPCEIRNKNVDCNNKSLTAVPLKLPTDTVKLFIENNIIGMIQKNDLVNLSEIEDLYLNHNEIENIEEGSLRHLKALQLLDISNNDLASLRVDLFQNNKELRFLYVRANLLTKLPLGLFDGLDSLKVIDFTQNRLITIPNGMFDNLVAWLEIWLHDNDFECDCHLQYYVNWIRTVQRFKQQYGYDAAQCRDTADSLAYLPKHFFYFCKEQVNGKTCDDLSTCQNTSVCINGVCVCPLNSYDNNGEDLGGVCIESYTIGVEEMVGVSFGSVIFLILVILAAYVLVTTMLTRVKQRKRKKKRGERMQKIIQTMTRQKIYRGSKEDISSLVMNNGSNIYVSLDHKKKRHTLIADLMKITENTALLVQEWMEIVNITERYSFLDAISEVNKKYNRDLAYVPYDNNRVKLEKGSHKNDYINASFITGRWSSMAYIATQSPMAGTVTDFWQMVWEQDVEVIVNVSYDDNDEKPSSARYWPESNVETFGMYRVEIKAHVSTSNSIVRQLKVRRKKESRLVTQCYLHNWKSCQFDQCSAFVSFLHLVWKNTIDRDEIVTKLVHCSHGCGRTGIFIALDIILRDLPDDHNAEITDIFHLVLRLRNERPKLIQNEEEYIFIYECIRYHLNLKEKKNRRMKLENAEDLDYVQF